MSTLIRAKKNLYNGGKCFTKNETYVVKKDITQVSSLMDIEIKNDLNQPHTIGGWWKEFEIVNDTIFKITKRK